MCISHHDEYDSTLSQAKGITPEELKTYRGELYEVLRRPGVLARSRGSFRGRNHEKGSPGISLEVYDRRVQMYRLTIDFLREVNADLKPDMQRIIKFGRETDEALFLFDERVADHLAELAKNAFRLRAVSITLSRSFNETAAKEEIELSTWFYEQFAETRKRFAPFLRLTG